MTKLRGSLSTSKILTILIFLFSIQQAHGVTIEFKEENYKFTAEERDVVQLIADVAEAEVRELLPTLDEQILLIVNTGKFVIEITGEGGMALSAGTVLWTVDHERRAGSNSPW